MMWTPEGKNHENRPKIPETQRNVSLTIRAAFVDVLLHLEVSIHRANVGLGSKHLRDVILLQRQPF